MRAVASASCSTPTARTAESVTPTVSAGPAPARAVARPRGAIPYRWPWCCCRPGCDDGRTGVVVIRRDIEPFRGELALPGGFIETGESWREAAVRELSEETGLRPERMKYSFSMCTARTTGSRCCIFGAAAGPAGRVAAAVGRDRRGDRVAAAGRADPALLPDPHRGDGQLLRRAAGSASAVAHAHRAQSASA